MAILIDVSKCIKSFYTCSVLNLFLMMALIESLILNDLMTV